jgi:hypothetical protein
VAALRSTTHAATTAELIAYHEAGHCIAAPTFGVPIKSVTIADRPHQHRGAFRSRLALEIVGTICLADPAAEDLFCGPPSPGDDGSGRDHAMAYQYLQQKIDPLRLGLESAACATAPALWCGRRGRGASFRCWPRRCNGTAR